MFSNTMMMTTEYAGFDPSYNELTPERLLSYPEQQISNEAFGHFLTYGNQLVQVPRYDNKSTNYQNYGTAVIPTPRPPAKVTATPALKHHVLLCEKHITCGSCPYEGKCKYIHDKGVASVCKFVNRPCKPDKDHGKFGARDSFFWPNSLPAQAGSTDEYILSPACEPKFYLRHRAVYSMWNHFKHFCHDNNTRTIVPDVVNDPSNCTNPFTSTRRLSVFMTLSSGRSPREDRSRDSPMSAPIPACTSTVPVPIPAVVTDERQCISSSPTSVSMFNVTADKQPLGFGKAAEGYSSHPSVMKNRMVNAVSSATVMDYYNLSSNVLSGKHYLL